MGERGEHVAVGESGDGGTSERSMKKRPKPSSHQSVEPKYNYTKIGFMMAAGAAVFGFGSFLYQAQSLYFKGKKRLDPEAPNMKLLEEKIYDIYFNFITVYYAFIQNDEKKRLYRKSIRESIYNAEVVFVIENQLLRQEIHGTTKDKIDANVFAVQSLEKLRDALLCFETSSSAEDAAQMVDDVSYLLSIHINNISVLIDNKN